MINISLSQELLLAIQRQVEQAGSVGPALEVVSPIAGGQINRSVVVRRGQQKYFVKLNRASRAEMFAAERDGLIELQRQKELRVPCPVAHGRCGKHAFLVLEYLELYPRGDAAALGAGLAAMHGITAEAFGWRRDNTIGTSPQANPSYQHWPLFWAEQRLACQLDMAADHGWENLREQAAELLQNPTVFFGSYRPQPSLLHGDLWSGNYAYLADGAPVLFDPATYYGDRETDLAMTELFGGFSGSFYAAYRAHKPLDAGYAVRKHYYQLYHVLNHLNLFGVAYLAHAEDLIDRLLAEIR